MVRKAHGSSIPASAWARQASIALRSAGRSIGTKDLSLLQKISNSIKEAR